MFKAFVAIASLGIFFGVLYLVWVKVLKEFGNDGSEEKGNIQQ
jgi:hypothetical protein